jgi:Amidohydrolase
VRGGRPEDRAPLEPPRREHVGKNGKKYFIVDSHLHFWDASPENWVKGREDLAKGWIECFHAYQGLGPEDTDWTIEKFMKYSEDDFEKDVFEDGKTDHGIFQSTYLKYWYRDGFNTLEQNAPMAEKYDGKLLLNGRWDPREGDAGMRQLEEDAKRYNLKGVKLYTAEWYNGSRGWTLNDPEAQPFLAKCHELGVKKPAGSSQGARRPPGAGLRGPGRRARRRGHLRHARRRAPGYAPRSSDAWSCGASSASRTVAMRPRWSRATAVRSSRTSCACGCARHV